MFMDDGFSPRMGQTTTETWMKGNTYLPKVVGGDTVAYEYIDRRGRWKWTLGVVKDQPIPRLTNLAIWKKKDRDLNDKEKLRSEKLLADINERTGEINVHKKNLEDKTNHVLVKRAHIALQTAEAEERMRDTHKRLEEAKTAVLHVDDADIREMRAYNTPPAMVRLVLEAVFTVLKNSAGLGKKKLEISWDDILAKIREKDFIQQVANFDVCLLRDETKARLVGKYMADPNFTYERARKASKAAGPLYQWVVAQLSLVGAAKENNECETNVNVLTTELNHITAELEMNRAKIQELEDEIVILNNEYEDLIEEQLEDDSVNELYLPTARRGNVTEWFQTEEETTIVSTSILNNMGVQECILDDVHGKIMRISPDKHSDIQSILVTARQGRPSVAGDSYMGASIPTGFKLGLPPIATPSKDLPSSPPRPSGFAAPDPNTLAELSALKAEVENLRAQLENKPSEDGGEDMDADATLRAATETAAAPNLDLQTPNSLAMAALEAEIERLVGELDQSKADKKASDDAMIEIEESVQAVLNDLEEAQQQVTDANALQAQSDADMEALKQSSASELEKAMLALAAIQAELDAAKASLADTEASKAGNDNELLGRIADLNTAKDAAETKASDLQNEIDRLQKANEEAQAQNDANQKSLTDANAKILHIESSHTTTVEEHITTLSLLRLEITSCEATISETVKRAEKAEEEYAEAHLRAESSQQEVSRLMNELEDLKGSKQVLSDAAGAAGVSDLKQSSMLDELEKLRSQIANLETGKNQLITDHLVEKELIISEHTVEKERITTELRRANKKASALLVREDSDEDGNEPTKPKTHRHREVVTNAALPLKEHSEQEVFSDHEATEETAIAKKKNRKGGAQQQQQQQQPAPLELLAFDGSLSVFNSVDISYTFLVALIQFCVSFTVNLPSAIGTIEMSSGVVYLDSSAMGALYALLRGAQALFVALTYLLIAPRLLRSSVADWKQSMWIPTPPPSINPIEIDRHSGGSVQDDSQMRCASRPMSYIIKKYSHYLLILFGIAFSASGTVLTLTSTPLIAGPLLGVGELLVFAGGLIMLSATGVSLQGGSSLLLAVAYFLAPIVAYFCIPTATSAGLDHLKMIGVYVNAVAFCAIVWLAMAPYKMRGHRRVAPVGTTPNSLENSANTSSGSHTPVYTTEFDHRRATTLEQQVTAAASCPFSALASQFPETWSSIESITSSYTQPLVAAGAAGSVIGIAYAFAESALGFAMASAHSIPSQASPAYVGQCVALMWVVAGINVAFVNRGVARVLELLGYPNTPNAPRDLLTSPVALKILTVIGVACCVIASLCNLDQTHILVTTCVFGLSIGYTSQELLSELFPAQFYRPTERGLQLYEDNFAKARVSSPFALMLICTALFSGFATNAFVFVVGVTQKISKDDPYGASPMMPSIILGAMCVIPAVLVLRGCIPCLKKESRNTEHHLEAEPLI